MGYRAIETEYKGYRFRSRLEARWAVCFDGLELKWVYEHEGFDLNELGWYLPDFWFPTLKCWGEVKPKPFTEIEFQKCRLLPDPCILLDAPQPMLRRGYYLVSLDRPECGFGDYTRNDDYNQSHILLTWSTYKGRPWFLLGQPASDYEIDATPEIMAKGARFEFGEHGHRGPRRTPQVYYGELPY